MEKVRTGDAVVIRAATWNAFIDAANFTKEMRQNHFGKGLRSGAGAGIVLVRNAESERRDRFAAMVLNDIAVPPNVNEDEFLSCVPVFVGRKMTEEREGKPYAVLLEPLEPDGIGRAMVMGITPAKVTVYDSDHQYAVPTRNSSSGGLETSETGVARILWKAGGSGEQWCLLQLGGAGGGGSEDKALLCQVQGGTSTSGYSVRVYPNGRDDGQSSYTGLLFVPDIAVDANLPNGTWIVGHKCLIASTGGNES